MGLTRLSLILTLPGLLVASEAAPEPKDKKPKTEAGATVTVTAEATSVELVKTPNPVKIITLDRIEQEGARDLGELLQRMLPGQLVSYGGPGTSSSLYLGGTKSNHTVVMLDGIRLKDSSSLGTDFSSFSTTGVDRVEVLQGAASTLYGADAHGGVVSLMSQQVSTQGFSGSASLASGNQGLDRNSLRTAYGWKGGWVTGSLDRAQEDPSVSVDTHYRKVSSHLGMGLKIAQDGLLTFNYRNAFQGAPLPYRWSWPDNKRSIDPSSDSTSRVELLQAGYRQSITSNLLLDLNVGSTESLRTYSAYASRYLGRSRQGLASLVYTPQDQITLTLLGDAQLEEAWTSDPGAKNVGRHLAVAGESTWEPIDALRLVGSLRHQWDRVGSTKAGNLTDEVATQATVWKAGINYRMAYGLRTYVSAGTAYNTPSLAQQRINASQGKAMLDNESSRTTNLGLDWQSGAWVSKLELHRSTFTNLVSYVPGGVTGYYINTKSSRMQGAELTGGRIEKHWNLVAFVRVQEGRDLSLPEDRQLTSFATRPFSAWGFRGGQTWGAWSLDGQLSRLGHRYNYSSDLGATVANKTHFTDASLALGWKANASTQITLRGDHLFQNPFSREAWLAGEDRNRNDFGAFPGFPAQTRTFSLEARYRF